MMNIAHVTDVTLMTIPQITQVMTQKSVLEFCNLILAMGADLAEMPSVLYRRIDGNIDPQNVSLRITSSDEYVYFKGRGVRNFSAGIRTFHNLSGTAQNYGETGFSKAITAIIHTKSINTYDDVSPQMRLCGLDNVMQQDYLAIFSSLIEKYGENLCLDPYNSCYTATATALEFVFGAGKSVCTSFGGIGGHAATEQLMAALNVTVGTKYNLTRLPRLRAVCETMAKRPLPGYSPVAGRDIFVYESGVHADGICKNPATYEPFEPSSVGASRKLSIGKHSGRAAIRQKLHEMGFMPGDCLVTSLNHAVRELSEKKGRGLSDAEFLSLYKDFRNGIEGD